MQPDRRMLAHGAAQDLHRHARRSPRRDVPGRDQAGVGEAGFRGDAAGAFEDRDLVTIDAEFISRGDPDDAGADDRNAHAQRRCGASAASIASPASSTVSSCRAVFQTMSPTGSSPSPWQGSDKAQPSRKLTIDGFLSKRALAWKKAASSATSGASAGATHGTVGLRQASKPRKAVSTRA